jgi:1-acyl-sn-glycerol-3-phosphate acyltransferase
MLYWYRVAAKLFCFATIGIGALFLSPLLYIFPRQNRKLVSFSFRLFIRLMVLLRGISVSIENREKFGELGGKIVASNHNSILDVVMLISLIPNADCIVKSSLSRKHVFQWITSKVYIPNSLDFSELSSRVGKSLASGNTLIIFPEGSRVSAGQSSVFKKGTARLALDLGCNIVPIRFGGNEKIGLRKGDKMLSYHPTEKYNYQLQIMPDISIEEYKDMPVRDATEKLTNDLRVALLNFNSFA